MELIIVTHLRYARSQIVVTRVTVKKVLKAMELMSAMNQSTNVIWEYMNVMKMHFALILTNHMDVFVTKDLMVMDLNAHWLICALPVHDSWKLVSYLATNYL